MKFWKLLGAFGCLCFLLVLVLSYWLQGPVEATNSPGPERPHAAPRIPTFN